MATRLGSCSKCRISEVVDGVRFDGVPVHELVGPWEPIPKEERLSWLESFDDERLMGWCKTHNWFNYVCRCPLKEKGEPS